VQASQVLPQRSQQSISVWTGPLSCWNRKGPSPNCCHTVGSTESSRLSSYVVALRFLFAGTKGPGPNHEKTAPDHFSSYTKLYSCIGAGIVFLASTKPRFVQSDCQMMNHITLHQSREAFPLLQSPIVASFTPLQPTLALRMVILCLCAAAQPSWQAISWCSRLTVIVLTFLAKAVWKLVMSVATEERPFLRTAALGGPVLWACVAYQFTSEPLLLLDISTLR
jgi:hypothetical protein